MERNFGKNMFIDGNGGAVGDNLLLYQGFMYLNVYSKQKIYFKKLINYCYIYSNCKDKEQSMIYIKQLFIRFVHTNIMKSSDNLTNHVIFCFIYV